MVLGTCAVEFFSANRFKFFEPDATELRGRLQSGRERIGEAEPIDGLLALADSARLVNSIGYVDMDED